MNNNDINDIRQQKDFNGKSFSKFKKVEVVKEYIQCILKNQIESACNWSAELICAGHFIALWDTILLIISKYIHIGNPKLPIYILMRFNKFKDIISNGYIGNELLLRNNDTIRKLFAEITSVLCLSTKKPGLETIKIKSNEFNTNLMSSKFKAPHINYSKDIFKINDPKELFIAINELAYQLDRSNNLLECCYWIEWIIELDNICRKKKEPLLASARSFAPTKHEKDIIWIIWELIIYKCNNEIQKKCVNALLELFSLKYNNSSKKKRRHILYFAIELLIESVNYNINIIDERDKIIISNVSKNIDKIYKNIKKNEITPKTDYLFNGMKPSKSNAEMSVKKLEILKKINS